MTMLAEAEPNSNKPLLSLRGRPIIFTPERIDQIRNLRERGKTPEEIAEIIGCTIGTLRVKCSNLGISLRALVPKNIMLLPKSKNAMVKTNGENGNGAKLLALPTISSEGFSLQLIYRGQIRTVPMRLSHQTVAMLALEAEMRGMRMGDLIVTIIEKVLERDLVDEFLSPLPPNSE